MDSGVLVLSLLLVVIIFQVQFTFTQRNLPVPVNLPSSPLLIAASDWPSDVYCFQPNMRHLWLFAGLTL